MHSNNNHLIKNNMFKKLTIRAKLLSGFTIVALIAAVVGVIGYWGTQQIVKGTNEIAEIRLPSILGLEMMNEAKTAVLLGERELFLKSLQDAEKHQAQYKYIEDAWKRAEEGWKIYEPLPQTAEEAQEWKSFVPVWKDWRAKHNEVMEMSRERDKLKQQKLGDNDKRIINLEQRIDSKMQESRLYYLECNSKILKLIDINMAVVYNSVVNSREKLYL
jgi:methyl-accepting chemotaxis protein